MTCVSLPVLGRRPPFRRRRPRQCRIIVANGACRLIANSR